MELKDMDRREILAKLKKSLDSGEKLDLVWGPDFHISSTIPSWLEKTGFVEKVWGNYQDLLRLPTKVIKILSILPNQKISNQKHLQRHETWHIISGTGQAILEHGDSLLSIDLSPGVQFKVSEETWHQVKADEDCTLIVLEIQEGAECRENDIIRKTDIL